MHEAAHEAGPEAGYAHGGAGPEHTLERLIFFSDAVFAIAITLLIIEIHVPHMPRSASDIEWINALLALTPNFIGFVVSFFVIGAFWAGHHRIFACAQHWSPRLVGPNLMLLCAIAAMPFFTALSSDYATARVPIAAYALWLLITGLLSFRLLRIATGPGIVGEHIPAPRIAVLRRRGRAVILGAATALVVALFAPYPTLALPALATMPLWRLLLERLAKR